MTFLRCHCILYISYVKQRCRGVCSRLVCCRNALTVWLFLLAAEAHAADDCADAGADEDKTGWWLRVSFCVCGNRKCHLTKTFTLSILNTICSSFRLTKHNVINVTRVPHEWPLHCPLWCQMANQIRGF